MIECMSQNSPTHRRAGENFESLFLLFSITLLSTNNVRDLFMKYLGFYMNENIIALPINNTMATCAINKNNLFGYFDAVFYSFIKR
ncbi:CLUMA_CG001127, isoform A [Clunio marinus]|uniref:CLUMA_CG001127, isoform A n=1 Tax=Clunio marinus TaxID=568069 RepID=A0A1J1HH44_9DIPT|nr:CLUMA_CG001127, isoform A [Clunio marinus]